MMTGTADSHLSATASCLLPSLALLEGMACVRAVHIHGRVQEGGPHHGGAQPPAQRSARSLPGRRARHQALHTRRAGQSTDEPEAYLSHISRGHTAVKLCAWPLHTEPRETGIPQLFCPSRHEPHQNCTPFSCKCDPMRRSSSIVLAQADPPLHAQLGNADNALPPTQQPPGAPPLRMRPPAPILTNLTPSHGSGRCAPVLAPPEFRYGW